MDRVIYCERVSGRQFVIVKRSLGDANYLCGYLEMLITDRQSQNPEAIYEDAPEVSFVGQLIDTGIGIASIHGRTFIGVDTLDRPYMGVTDVIDELTNVLHLVLEPQKGTN